MHKYAKIQPPCYICTERHVGCHSECEAYKRFRAEREAMSKKRMLNYGATGFSIDSQEKVRKKQRHAKRK